MMTSGEQLIPLDGATRRSLDSIKWNHYAEDVLPLWVADMDYPAAPAILEAIQARVAVGDFGYRADSPGLRAAIVKRMAARYGWEIQPEWIVFAPGLVFAMNAFTRAFGKPGDGALMLTPLYPPFFSSTANAGVVAQAVPMVENKLPDGTLGYDIDFDALEAAVTPQTRFLMLCNPHNPVGKVYSPDDLRRLAALALKHDLLILSDEIHSDLLLYHATHTPLAALVSEIGARTITLIAPSKTFNLAGMGLGAAIVQDSELRGKLAGAMFGVGGFPSSLAFTAAEAAYRHGQPWLDQMLAHLRANRDLLTDYIREHLPMLSVTHPESTYLTWIDCRALPLPEGVSPAKFFEEKARVGLNDGATFGQPGVGYVRLNFACTRETLLQALERMHAAIADLPSPAEV